MNGTVKEEEKWLFDNENTTGSVLRSTRLRESNRATVKRMMEAQQRAMAESLRKSYRVNVLDEKTFPFWDKETQSANINFSQRKFREAVYSHCYKLREANVEGALQQFLRAQINTITNGYYNLVETVHESIAQVVPSKMFIELYAPMYRGDVPRQVVRGQTFPEGRIVGEDIQMRNRKFGIIYPFERELWEDDQSGMVAQRSADGGEQMKILKDAWSFQKFIGTAGTYGDDPIPACETVPADETSSTFPWATSAVPLQGGGINRPTSYGAMTPALIQAGDLALMQQLDKLGNKLLVNPNTLLVGTSNKFTARTLLNSQWYPTTTSVKIGGGAGTDSTIGTSFAENVMKGLYNLVVARFLPVKAWSVLEAGKGFVFQQRTPLEVTQENPQSGPAFSADEFRFKVRERWNVDWIEPRFAWLGNDGTV